MLDHLGCSSTRQQQQYFVERTNTSQWEGEDDGDGYSNLVLLMLLSCLHCSILCWCSICSSISNNIYLLFLGVVVGFAIRSTFPKSCILFVLLLIFKRCRFTWNLGRDILLKWWKVVNIFSTFWYFGPLSLMGTVKYTKHESKEAHTILLTVSKLQAVVLLRSNYCGILSVLSSSELITTLFITKFFFQV